MSGPEPSGTLFSAEWLALREAFDTRAREAADAAFDLRAGAARLRPDGEALRVLDLACGSGANLRHLAPRLGGAQHWTLVDHDPGLLAAVPDALAAWTAARGFSMDRQGSTLRLAGPGWQADVDRLRIDLSHSLSPLPWARTALVTASALLDLVSRSWIEQLIARVQETGAAVLFALNVDGRLDWHPALPDDAAIARLFAGHQARDKGFGPALGPSAAAFTAERLAAIGWRCAEARTDWLVDAGAGATATRMLHAMVEGIATAALEQAPGERERVDAWKQARNAAAAHGRLQVGHTDLFATPATAPPSVR